LAFLKRLIRIKRFSDFSRIRDYAAKCGDLEAEKFQNQREKDSLADQVESEPFSTPESSQQTQFGSKLVQSPIAGYADRMCQ
jgi:hypothetical protein